MTLVLVCAGLVLLSLALAAPTPRRARAVDRWWLRPTDMGTTPAAVAVSSSPRTSPRVSAQTGVAVLALALALDGSVAAAVNGTYGHELAFAAQASPVFEHSGISYEAPATPSWSLAAYSDGWIV
jgi:hypothetical protein